MGKEYNGYNGYVNYPTWDVVNWVMADETLSQYFSVAITDCSNEYEFSRKLTNFFNELTPIIPASLFSDLLNYAIEQVDWEQAAHRLWDYFS